MLSMRAQACAIKPLRIGEDARGLSMGRNGRVASVRRRTARAAISSAFTVSLIFLVTAGMIGCGADPEPPRSDPAMENHPPDSAEMAVTASAPPAPDPTAPLGPHRKDGKIYFPQTGWLDETQFWEMYETRPQDIPEDIDLHTAHLLKEEYLRELSNPGET